MPDKTTIAIAPGDGIGPEIMDAVLRVFTAAQVPLRYDFVEMGRDIYLAGHSTGMTRRAKMSVEENGILFKGPLETPKGVGVKSINVTARKVWSTYANKRVFRSLAGVDTVFSKAHIPINITVIRENIEDTYGGIEHALTYDVALCRRFITRPGSLQLHHYAFETARHKGAKQIACAHKANIMKITDGIFLETFYQVAKDYPEIAASDIIVDDLAMKLVARPETFEVVVLPNFQGDIISDLCAGLVGGLGFAPSANIGDNISIFEAVHGTAPDIAGQNKANPTALLLSGCMMLRHLRMGDYAATIENALLFALESGARTADFGDPATSVLSTKDFAQAIIASLGSKPTRTPLAEAGVSEKNFQKPLKPLAHRMLRTENPPSGDIMGADFFIESTKTPDEIGKDFTQLCAQDYDVTTISNRGTQVWPEASLFTELIDQYRVRIERKPMAKVTQAEILQFAGKVAGAFRICSMEYLMAYGGKKGYSLAQGQ